MKRKSEENMKRKSIIILLVILGLIVYGNFRIYFGGERFVCRIVKKTHFSLRNPVVDLETFLERSRKTITNNYPAIKKELEEMNIIYTDQEVLEEIQSEIRNFNKKYYKNFKGFEENM